MGHYASEMGDPPDFAAEYQANERRLKVVMPFLEQAFLSQLASWPDPEGANGYKDGDQLWRQVTGEAETAISELELSEEYPIYSGDVRQAFLFLCSAGLINWVKRISLTEEGRARVKTTQG